MRIIPEIKVYDSHTLKRKHVIPRNAFISLNVKQNVTDATSSVLKIRYTEPILKINDYIVVDHGWGTPMYVESIKRGLKNVDVEYTLSSMHKLFSRRLCVPTNKDAPIIKEQSELIVYLLRHNVGDLAPVNRRFPKFNIGAKIGKGDGIPVTFKEDYKDLYSSISEIAKTGMVMAWGVQFHEDIDNEDNNCLNFWINNKVDNTPIYTFKKELYNIEDGSTVEDYSDFKNCAYVGRSDIKKHPKTIVNNNLAGWDRYELNITSSLENESNYVNEAQAELNTRGKSFTLDLKAIALDFFNAKFGIGDMVTVDLQDELGVSLPVVMLVELEIVRERSGAIVNPTFDFNGTNIWNKIHHTTNRKLHLIRQEIPSLDEFNALKESHEDLLQKVQKLLPIKEGDE